MRLSLLNQGDYLHRFAEATSITFADRNRWVGDVRRMPVTELLSTGFDRERAGGGGSARVGRPS